MIHVVVTGTAVEVRVNLVSEAQEVANRYGRRVRLFDDRRWVGDLVPRLRDGFVLTRDGGQVAVLWTVDGRTERVGTFANARAAQRTFPSACWPADDSVLEEVGRG